MKKAAVSHNPVILYVQYQDTVMFGDINKLCFSLCYVTLLLALVQCVSKLSNTLFLSLFFTVATLIEYEILTIIYHIDIAIFGKNTEISIALPRINFNNFPLVDGWAGGFLNLWTARSSINKAPHLRWSLSI